MLYIKQRVWVHSYGQTDRQKDGHGLWHSGFCYEADSHNKETNSRFFFYYFNLYNNLDCTCALIGQEVCFRSAMKHENDVSIEVGCFQVARIHYFMKEIIVYIRASYIVFLFVKTKNNNFIKEIKHVLRASKAWWKPRQSLWKVSSKWKPSTASRVFTDLLLNSLKRSPRFSRGYEGRENMLYFLISNNMDKI